MSSNMTSTIRMMSSEVLERTKKSQVRSNDKKQMSGDDTSSTPGTMYRKRGEQNDIRMKKENCNITSPKEPSTYLYRAFPTDVP